ncbi:MAG: hypothetical protein K0R67_3714 [Paenibacillus sp.]|jgi:hypothetical protein|nr:hypothetical protein [Paenibacillus sp.]
MKEHYDITLLEPSKIHFVRSPGGMLTLDTGTDFHPEVWLYRSFPLSMQERFISVRNSKGEELGMIEDLAELSEDSIEAVQLELSFRYMIPKVTKILKIKQLPGMWQWDLETTLGPIKLSMRNLHEHVQRVGGAGLLLTDLDGNRCEISDTESLDASSKRQLGQVL